MRRSRYVMRQGLILAKSIMEMSPKFLDQEKLRRKMRVLRFDVGICALYFLVKMFAIDEYVLRVNSKICVDRMRERDKDILGFKAASEPTKDFKYHKKKTYGWNANHPQTVQIKCKVRFSTNLQMRYMVGALACIRQSLQIYPNSTIYSFSLVEER
eukprot:TRINITY_DN7302_c0_g2_i2.p1 TRINITY_DN7302_c0_g2~~TRINITY_DN7302_c0_g2_i2.p1  ORF type:complete len:156 (+),score=12.70 TRINITY_DN7302_c0_g2_i2:347-814(+)